MKLTTAFTRFSLQSLNHTGYKHVVWLCAAFYLVCSACSTGIEGTKRINIPRSEEKQMQPSPEQMLTAGVVAQPLSEWHKGKEFEVVSSRASLLLRPAAGGGEVALQPGDIIAYAGIDSAPMPDGRQKALVLFDSRCGTLVYDCGLEKEAAAQKLLSDRVPMCVDTDMVRATSELLAGRTVWTLSSLWLDGEGNKIRGRRFVPVTVIDVIAGNEAFPGCVRFATGEGQTVMTAINFGSSSADSRSFADLFSLTDPRKNYPDINDAHWQAIQSGDVLVGMTKEECRLSLGNPDEAAAGHDYSQTIDIWRYRGGTTLRFTDGVLSDFRL